MNVFVAESPIHGRGVFAFAPIYEDEWQWMYGERRVVDPASIEPWMDYCFEWDSESLFLPDSPFRFLNHSSNPNCVANIDIGGNFIMVITALRCIEPNEELTIQYADYVNWETWKFIPEYEDQYEISDTGVVRSLDRRDSVGRKRYKRVLKEYCGPNGYPQVTLTKDSKQRKFYVHDLVLLSFVGPKPLNSEVLHKDGSRNNNILSNLAYGSRKDNMQDAIRHGTTRAKPVRRSDGKIFRSIQEAARLSHCSSATVINSIAGRHKTRNFKFELI